MTTPRLRVWEDAKARARTIAQQSRYNDWARDVRQLKTALLEEHPILREFPGMSSRIALDALDIVYLEVHPTVPVDPVAIERRYAALAETLGATQVPEQASPAPDPEERTAESSPRHLVWIGAAASILLLIAGSLWSRPAPPKSVNPADSMAIVGSLGGSSGEQEQQEEAKPVPAVLTTPTFPTVPASALRLPVAERAVPTYGYFERDGKLFVRMTETDTIWSTLWKGPFRFYTTWDETLAQIRALNPGLDPDRIPPRFSLAVADLQGMPCDQFLARFQRDL